MGEPCLTWVGNCNDVNMTSCELIIVTCETSNSTTVVYTMDLLSLQKFAQLRPICLWRVNSVNITEVIPVNRDTSTMTLHTMDTGISNLGKEIW